MPPELTVVGSVNLDLVARCERLPRPGETLTDASFDRYPGGKGANQAGAAARLGAEVTFIGSVGADDFAEEALAGLREAGVETVLREGGPTGVAVIIVDARGRLAGATLVATGPLTNVALLLARYPDARPERIVLMGGAIAEGNVTPAAEFNIWADPEAAARVFTSGIDVTMVGLDVTHQTLLTAAHAEQLRDAGRIGRFVAELLDFYGVFHREVYGFDGSPVHDAVALAQVIRPDLLELEHLNVRVDCESELCRGRTVVDVWRRTGLEPNANVAVGIDSEAFLDLLLERLARLG